MKILNIEQGTKAWHDARLQMVTGTKLDAVMGTASARVTLIAELIAEKATEQAKAFVATQEMERGTAEEVFALKAFEEKTGKRVARIGMCVSEEEGFEFLANSPDGLIANAEGKYTEAVEVKSPDSKKAILYRMHNMISKEELGLLSAKGLPLASAPFLGVPADYKWQMVDYFLVNPDLERLHFVTYDARMIDDEMKLYVVTVERSNELLQEAMEEARLALTSFRKDWQNWESIVLPDGF